MMKTRVLMIAVAPERSSRASALRSRGQKALGAALIATLGALLAACSKAPPTSPAIDRAGTVALRATPEPGGKSFRSQVRVFEGAGDINASVEAFRAALGRINPNQPGSFGSGRREINWDAVPAAFTNVDNFPADFFNQPAVGRARGALFSTRGTGFRVSDTNFVDINPSYVGQFEFFSPTRTFIAVGDNLTGVQFFVPGSSTPATTTGFGVVFSDIDRAGSSRLSLFDAAGRSLGSFSAPASPSGVSFLGVMFPEPIVARVEIVSGQGALGPASFDVSSRKRGPGHDLVIMDDFLYGEPIAAQAVGR